MAVDITNNSAFFAGLGCVNICANVPHSCNPLFIQSVCSLNMTMAEILNTVPHCTFKTCERWSHTSLKGANTTSLKTSMTSLLVPLVKCHCCDSIASPVVQSDSFLPHSNVPPHNDEDNLFSETVSKQCVMLL